MAWVRLHTDIWITFTSYTVCLWKVKATKIIIILHVDNNVHIELSTSIFLRNIFFKKDMTGKANLILTLWDVKNEYKAKCNKYSKELTTESEISIKTLYLLI